MGAVSVFNSSSTLGTSEVMTGAVVETSPTWGTTRVSSFLASVSVGRVSVSLSFLPRKPPKMEARLRETLRDLLFDFLAFFSSSDELLEEDPARAGETTVGSVAAVSPSASLGVASRLFLGAEADAVAPASVVGLPV
jgi:hypothetical protein